MSGEHRTGAMQTAAERHGAHAAGQDCGVASGAAAGFPRGCITGFVAVQSRAPGGAVAMLRRAGPGFRRPAAAAAAAAALCCVGATLLLAGGSSRASLAAVGGAQRGRAGAELGAKALADVREMYRQNPALFKEFALLTGSRGQKLLSQVAEPVQPAAPRAFKGPSLHTLDTYMRQLSALTLQDTKRVSEEQVHDWPAGEAVPATAPAASAGPVAWHAFATADVNKRTAWMMVNDLSNDWDKSSNYSVTPWEFCAGRNLSPRQIRECVGHLIRVAGVHSHRDLNVNAKIYDRFCTGDGHQYIDKQGNPIFLPVGSRKMCAKVAYPTAAVPHAPPLLGPPPPFERERAGGRASHLPGPDFLILRALP
jgi:hypothetical protein